MQPLITNFELETLIAHPSAGSVIEFSKVIPLLTSPRADSEYVFEVIAPSIPGYGWSSPAHQKGLNIPQVSRILEISQSLDICLLPPPGGKDFQDSDGRATRLRDILHAGWRLGQWNHHCHRYSVPSKVRFSISRQHSFHVVLGSSFSNSSVRGLHLNMPWNQAPAVTMEYILSSILPAGWVYPANEDLSRVLPLGNKLAEAMLEFGYMHLQATKPDTIGVGLNRRETISLAFRTNSTNNISKCNRTHDFSSPLGLASYILEKFATWTNGPESRTANDGLLTEKFTLDELLDNVMIYWTTKSIATSMRFYAENLNKKTFTDPVETSVGK